EEVLGGSGLRIGRPAVVHGRADEGVGADALGQLRVRQRQSDHEQRLVDVADRQQQVRIAAAACAGDVVFGLPPSGPAPQQRLVQAHGLDPVERDDLSRGGEQTVVDGQPGFAEADDEVRIVEVLPEDGEGREDAGQDTDEDRDEGFLDPERQHHDGGGDDDQHHENGDDGLGLEQGGDDDPVDGDPDDLAGPGDARGETIGSQQFAEAVFGLAGDVIGHGAESLAQAHAEAVVAAFGNGPVDGVLGPAEGHRGVAAGRRGIAGGPPGPGQGRLGPFGDPLRAGGRGRVRGTRRALLLRPDCGEQFVAQLFGALLRQVLQGDVRSGAAGDVEDELGHAEDPGQQLLLQVDGLDPIEAGLAQLLRQQTPPVVDRFGVDSVADDTPGQPAEEGGEEEDQDDSADDGEDDQRMFAQPAGECQVDAAAGGEVLDDRLEEVLQTVGRGDEDADEDAEAFEDRRQRMDSMPGLG